MTILANLDTVLKNWAYKERFELNCFTGWKLKFIELLDKTISSLKKRYTGKLVKFKSVFSDPNV